MLCSPIAQFKEQVLILFIIGPCKKQGKLLGVYETTKKYNERLHCCTSGPIDDLKRTEDSHEAVAGDGREGEHAGHHAHHSVERVQLAEDSCKANLL